MSPGVSAKYRPDLDGLRALAVLAVLGYHAFPEWLPGGRLCTVTDSEEIIRHRQTLAVYFPETVEVDLARYPTIAQLRQGMVQAGFGDVEEVTAEFVCSLTDAAPYRARAFSCLQLIPDPAFQRGIGRMESDLQSGPIPAASRHLLLWGVK
jgi:hypothetical protein